MDQDSVKLVLLIEAAHTHQRLSEAAIEKLNKEAQGLEPVVREQVQHALAGGLRGLHAEIQGAVEALQRTKRATNARLALWTFGVTAAAVAIALFVAWRVLPTPTEIDRLRAARDELASNIAVLDQRGARADLRRCGTGHLCVRVDLKAPRYGESSDYLVVKGY